MEVSERVRLHNILVSIMTEYNPKGEKSVFFNSPNNVKMTYPAIVYQLTSDSARHADNLRYFSSRTYQVIVIENDPDSPLPTMIVDKLQYASINTTYVADGLHHTTLTVSNNGIIQNDI